MSLSDYVKYLRAVKGGLTPWEIAEGSGVSAREIHLIEVKHRRVGDDDADLQRLAQFFGVPAQDLTARREAYRKRFTSFLEEHQSRSRPVTLKLEDGEELTGSIDWFGREAMALVPTGEQGGHAYIIQRGWVANWKAADADAWQVGSDA